MVLAMASAVACNKEAKPASSDKPADKAADKAAPGAAIGATIGSGSSTTPTAPPATTAPMVAPPAAPQISLLQPGIEPRTELRYKVAKGFKQGVEIDINMTMDGMPTGKMIMPTMVMNADMSIDDVSADGNMLFKLVTTEMTAKDAPGSSVPASMMAPMMSKMKGLTTTATMDPMGKVSDMKLNLDNAAPEVQQMMSSLRQSFDQLTTPLPKEAVGKGAKWRSVVAVEQNGIKVTATTTFELIDLTGSVATLKGTLELSAPPQTITQKGVTIDLKKMSGNGTVESKLDLTKLAPTAQTTMALQQQMNAMGQDMNMSINMNVSMLPK